MLARGGGCNTTPGVVGDNEPANFRSFGKHDFDMLLKTGKKISDGT
jgi:hypothetical protein